jgi:general nucleoside transport system permease protein
VHAIATVTFGVDHIISGVAINILAPGVARYLSDQVFRNYDGGSVSKSPGVDQFSKFDVPIISDALAWIDEQDWFFISDVAGLLEGLFTQITIFTIITYALVPISAWILWKTRFGLRVRICGENPSAGESLGVNILRYKFVAVIISGALAGLAGAFIVAELTGFYQQGQTTGRGFIGLAALIFGNWRAGGVLAGALVFGYPFGLSLQDLDGSATHNLLLVVGIVMLVLTAWFLSQQKTVDGTISGVLAIAVLTWYGLTDTAPNWLPNAMPYAIVLVVLVFASQHLRMPAADGVPYRKGDH